MDSTCDLIVDSLKEEPIGETDHFIWFITDIGIVTYLKERKTLKLIVRMLKLRQIKLL